VLTMPLFFASNAIYPLSLMPEWLRRVAKLNPLTYLVDALRGLMVQGEQSVYGLAVDCAVLAVVFAALVLVTVRIYPRLAQ
jgi:ABC-2 type transport system permease protein